ncbi:protein JOKA2-like isoform X2 [Silene latifolia]|uniref:protein JOKA2-like isoform X2 n=1 Tax=Silene latifolia TaxID=37657 RepID=UPI003D774A0F
MASLVIKVKYEETLRRFNVAINGDRRLDLSVEGLRLKICSLFNLPSDSQFRLTYKDEDDDLVALVDDDDLHDVVRQGLDPVRITVHLISDQKPHSSSAHPSGSSLNHNGIKTVNSDENGSIRSDIPESVTLRFFKKPQPEPIKCYGSSKVGVLHENAILSNFSVGNDTKPSSDGRKHEGVKSDGTEKRSQVTGVGVSVKAPSNSSIPLYSSYKSSSSKWSKSAHGNKNKDDRAAGFQSYPAFQQSFKQIHPPNRNMNKTDNMTSIVHTGITCDGCGLHPISGPRFKSKVRYDYDLCRGCFLRVGNEMDYSRIDLPLGYKPPQFVKASDADNSGSIFHNGITCDGCGVVPISGPRFKSKVKYNYDLCRICFSQTGNILEYARIDIPLTYSHLDRAPDVDHLGVIIHNGVSCDRCGVLPIRGSRFKSKVRYDYDLCSACFTWMGNYNDYIKITRIGSPTAYTHPRSICVPDLSPHPYMTAPWKYPIPKLDSCFIKDVSIPNGTTMAPLTPFTKIWRMRNNGTLSWFRGVHLIWVGGDRFHQFSPSDSVEIQVPAFGVHSGQELNIAVGFIAPEFPGQYTSFWRMVSGQMFGQKVSVKIQVDHSVDLTRETLRTLDLNLPPSSSKTVFPEVANVKAEPGLDIEVTNSSAPSIVDQNRKIQMIALNFEINDDLPPVANSDGPGSPVGPSSVSYPEADASSYSIPEASTPIQSDPTSDNHGELLPSSVSYPEADASSYSIPEASTPIQSDPTSDNHGELLPSSVSYPEADASSDSIPEASTPIQSDPTSDNHGELLPSSVSYPEADASSDSIPEASIPVQSDPTNDGEFLAAGLDAGNLDNNATLDKNINLEQVNEKTETAEKLVEELEQMGFKQIELEKEDDSEQSVDDLSDDSDSDWDPILEELMEMGFEDKDANKKLLAKNNGSITRVVMDLIAEEKA